MHKFILISLFCVFGLTFQAQTKKPVPAKKKAPALEMETPPDSLTILEPEGEPPLPTEFKVYTKPFKAKVRRTKLCINLINGDSTFNYCMNDSLLRDPEMQKILYQQRDQDSTFTLIYVSAFTKDPNKPECQAGRESKLYFVRTSNTTNKGIVKQKFFESCQKTITRLGKEPIENWDGSAPLKITYNRGANFLDIIFDPARYKLGIQSSSDAESK